MVTLLHLGSTKIIKPTNFGFKQSNGLLLPIKGIRQIPKEYSMVCNCKKNVAMTDVPALKLGFPAYFSASADCHRIMIKRHNAKFHLVLLNL